MFNNLSIRSRLMLILCAMSVLAISLSTIGLVGIKFSNSSLQTVYIDRLVPTSQLTQIKTMQLDSRLKVANSVIFPDEAEKNIVAINENMTEIKKLWESYMATYLTPEETILANKFAEDRKTYREQALLPALALIKSGDRAGLEKLIIEKIRPLYETLSKDINDLVQLQLDVSQHEYEDAQKLYDSIFVCSIIMLVLGLSACFFIDLKLIRRITNALDNAKNVMTAIAKGDLSSRIVIESNDEISELLLVMQTMQSNLKTIVTDIENVVSAAVKGNFNTKIDIQGKSGFGKDISSLLNQLSDTVDTAFKDTIRVAGALANGDLNQRVTKDYKGLFGLTAKGVNDTVDSLTKIVNEIQTMVDAAAIQGEFSYKMNLNDKAGYTKTIAESLNKLSNVTDEGLHDVLRVANALADGDLTQKITKDYSGIFGQVKAGVNNTAESLASLLLEIKETTNMIAAVSTEIASGNNDLAHRTEQQAAALEETAASMQQLTSTVSHNSENAKQANSLAVGATEAANRGVSVVRDVVSTMDNINESSLRIVDIISVIDDIAFQTNILALNAAVEAARAGEQGSGFAVVAIEVRNLAQRSANAAGEIKRLISDSVDRVSGGSKQVAEAGQTMQEIVTSIEGVNKIISEISSASAEQSAGIAQVGAAITSMDDVTQQNAALVEEVAATAESLETQTQHLAKELAHFRMDNYSTGSQKQAAKVAMKSAPASVKTQTFNTASMEEVTASKNTFVVGNDDWEEF